MEGRGERDKKKTYLNVAIVHTRTYFYNIAHCTATCVNNTGSGAMACLNNVGSVGMACLNNIRMQWQNGLLSLQYLN